MKKIIMLCSFACLSLLAAAQSTARKNTTDSTKNSMIVDAACGSCKFGMKGACKLAVKIEEKPYWVSGISIDEFGDAHAADGMCNMVRKAAVTGQLEGEKFVAKKITLLPVKETTD